MLGALRQTLAASPERVPDRWRNALDAKVLECLRVEVTDLCAQVRATAHPPASLLDALRRTLQDVRGWRSRSSTRVGGAPTAMEPLLAEAEALLARLDGDQ